jgi:hypothetical protein
MVTKSEFQDDVTALGTVLDALSKLDSPAQQWVLRTAATRLQVPAVPGQPVPPISPTPAGALPAGTVGELGPKDFLRVKAPKSDVDRVACLAFYLTHGRQTNSYAARDVTAINTEAAGPKINMSRAVDNATNQSGYLTSAGKGKKQITALGEDVVNALPDYQKVKEIIATGRRKARRKKGKAKRA